MEPAHRHILIGLGLVFSLTLAAVVASLLVPFAVNVPVVVQHVSDAGSLLIPGQDPVPLSPAQLNERFTLKADQGISVEPGSTATVLFFDGGRAILSGPASLTLLASQRRATAPGHISERFSRTYELRLSQSQGSIRYDFSQSVPSFDDLRITVELPDTRYTPTTPCWTIDVTAEGPIVTQSLPCP
jgi:hypothetical protein